MNNREFKFRLWSKSDNIFINPNILEVWDKSGNLTPFQYIKTGKLDPIYMPIENYTIQQYTGCEDKNNKEIYEGDIVSHKGYKGQISFLAGMFLIDYPDQTDSGPIGFLQTLDIEVIGNIFEHKDLLKL